jgi:hypothetical protein
MNVFEQIHSILQVIYTFMPKDVLLIVMVGLVFIIYLFFREVFKKWISQKLKQNSKEN